MSLEGGFPYLHGTARLGAKDSDNQTPVFDIKFYPYDKLEASPIFAVVAGRDILVCRPNSETDTPFHILKQIRDPNEDVVLNSLVWSQDLATGDPLLCVAGAGFKSINVFNALTGNLVRVISGHGGDINDLAISPRSPEILASCSADYQIRLWTLDPCFQKQPCAAILSGNGHKQPILTLAFHPSGRYLLSGGEDTMVCLWSIPDMSNEQLGHDPPTQLYYPHFATTEVHSDYVDCIKFWGDLILSRACGGVANKKDAGKGYDEFKRNDIILWKIDGFPSTATDLAPPVPVHGVHTRSAFGGRFQRLLTFELAPATPFYMRFGLFDQPGFHPMLAMGNELSKYSFWDLQRLEGGYEAAREEQAAPKPSKKKRGRQIGEGAFSALDANIGREGSLASNASSTKTSHVSDPSSAPSELKFDIADPHKPLAAHKAIVIPGRLNFACRQVAWSNCGKWCVAVGDYAMIALFKR